VGTWRAYSALLLWVPITWYVFRTYPKGRAALICFLGGYMFLPELTVFKLPLFPQIGKARIILLSMTVGLLFFSRGKRGRLEPFWYAILLLDFVGSMGSWMTNTDAVHWGPVVLQGHTFKDGMFLFLSSFTEAILASYLGMACFRSEKDLDSCITMLAGAGLVYAVPILWEARMSPQLHRWIYGYAAFDDFIQSVRWGGYRPQVFMTHGLMTSLFMLGPATVSMAATRLRMRVWKTTGRVAAWVTTIAVVICKSTGVWFYALLALPLARWGSVKTMTRVATVIILISLLYPWLRATERIPLDTLVDYAGQIDAERQQSLKFRFDNEEMLLARAMERPWFGWGSYGRNRVYNEYGRDISTTDGGWVLALGSGGLIGYLASFGLPVLSVLTVARRTKKVRDPRTALKIAVLNMYLAVFWFDMLPNAPYVLLTQFLGGALCSITYHLLAEQRIAARASARAPQQQSSPARARGPLPSRRPEPSGAT
jgi:hypothetical protein